MTISTDTIRTVIEIVPDWEILELPDYSTFAVVPPAGSGICDCSNVQNFPLVLDALAAAAVRVVDEKVQCVITSASTEVYEVWHRDKRGYAEGPNRTENTLLAIAEFVKGGGFDVS